MSPSHSNITDTGSKKGEVVENVSDPHIFCRKKEATVNSLEVTRTSNSVQRSARIFTMLTTQQHPEADLQRLKAHELEVQRKGWERSSNKKSEFTYNIVVQCVDFSIQFSIYPRV